MVKEFVRRKDLVAQASVCRDVPPKSLRKKSKKYMPNKVINYQFVRLKVPEEYVFALQEKYPGKGLQAAVMLLIKKHVEPVQAEGEG